MPAVDLAPLKSHAVRAFRVAIRRADPALAMREALEKAPLSQPKHGCKTIVLAIGKAAPAMMRAVLPRINGPRSLICVTHRENREQVPGAEIFRAGHPIPDTVGAAGARRIIELLKGANAGDVVIALVSGGGSALLPAPPTGVDLSEKQVLNRILLESGLDIVDVNMIRQQVSQLKGGGLSRLAYPAPVTAYILSDVIGDDLRAISSGPTVAPIGTPETARQRLLERNLFPKLPISIQHHLRHAKAVPTKATPCNHLIGGNRESVLAAADHLQKHFDTTAMPSPLIGDVGEAATTIVQTLMSAANKAPPRAFVWGGETTVMVHGAGLGGRNQELALRVAMLADVRTSGRPWVLLSAGTDGRDGPTDAAGAIVDHETSARIRKSGHDPASLLQRNDSNTALGLSDDLLVTGATGTNVADIQILLVP